MVMFCDTGRVPAETETAREISTAGSERREGENTG